MCAYRGILWKTARKGLFSTPLISRGFLSTSTSHSRVVPYSRLDSTELSTESTVVNTVKELIRRRQIRSPRGRRLGCRRERGHGGDSKIGRASWREREESEVA